MSSGGPSRAPGTTFYVPLNTPDVEDGRTPPDYARAFPLFEQACNGKLPAGCDDLGELYRTGKGVTKDRPHAIELYRGACTARYTPACDHLKTYAK